MYHIVTGGYHDSGFKALLLVSRLCYIVILKHVLPSVHYADVNMNTVKPVCNDHLYNKIYYLWFIQ